ncbi:alpha/beta hydrolase [Paracoccus acridae]|uniref:Alpha/beta hydrolase n=1 Tax=Paracoccus acridae TaxID=1795310 RepID=A0ABQ1VMN1_9RHOB|nr:alpha/beta hydrolase [Paracoccus acridae]
MTNPRERYWVIDDLPLTGLAWGPDYGTPVLALHGWMDHAGSFQILAPLLHGCHVMALDLSGQGHSGHRAAHATYNIWDDLPQIVGVLDQLGWQDCVLLGHSRGANISALLAAALPERARAFVALDSLVPEPTKDSVVATLRAFFQQTRSQAERPARIFKDRDAYITRRVKQGNSVGTAEALAGRALEETPEGFRMRGDPRLFASSAIKLTQSQVDDVLQAIRCPILNIWATKGILQSRPKFAGLVRRAENLVSNYEKLQLAGDHHLHLEANAARQIAKAVLACLERHGLR